MKYNILYRQWRDDEFPKEYVVTHRTSAELVNEQSRNEAVRGTVALFPVRWGDTAHRDEQLLLAQKLVDYLNKAEEAKQRVLTQENL